MRTVDVIAQVFDGAKVEARQHPILSPGQIVELGRGECGNVKAFQVTADFRTIVLQCDNCAVTIQMGDDFGVKALRALFQTQLNMPADEVRPGMIAERFTLGADGRPVKVATDPAPDRRRA